LLLIPALSEIPGSGWSLDTTTDYQLPTGVDSASGTVAQVQAKATDLVDGGPIPSSHPATRLRAWAWEDLTDGNYYMKVKIWNMGSAAAAKELYTGLLSDSYFSQDNNSWVTCTATACPTP